MSLDAPTLTAISQKVWKWVSEGYDTQIEKGEETITDLLLTKIVQADSTVKMKKFSHYEEDTNGADFAIEVGGKAFLVQAKKMYASGEFSAVQGEEGLTQCNKLIESAVQNGAIPIYIFYIGAKGRATSGEEGCVLVPAEKVFQWIWTFSKPKGEGPYKQKWISADTLTSEDDFGRPLKDLLKW